MKNTNTKTLTRVALLVAIELVMKLVGLGSVPVGPLYMSFLTLPIAVGAITMGPAVGALLGGGGALYWFKLRKPKADTRGADDLDDYDYGEDEEEEDYEFEDENTADSEEDKNQ